MPVIAKIIAPIVFSFFLTSSFTVIVRTEILSSSCDPKFKYLCSIECMFLPIVFITLILAIAFVLAYSLIGRNRFHEITKQQVYVLSTSGVLLAVLAFGHPLVTIVIVYGGYFVIWLPLCIIISLAVLKWCAKYNKATPVGP